MVRTAEMGRPLAVAELESDSLGPAAIEKARHALGELRRLDGIVEIGPEREQGGVGPIGSHCSLKAEADRAVPKPGSLAGELF